ncbi:hypothetical protein Tco_1016071 [Tanacetum coccineum]|uniref:Uncharacterized protein n=1 Tax=Tanacetum coccineum TaxID=301880 RepID=A0ABQ5FMQ4_9ASTR
MDLFSVVHLSKPKLVTEGVRPLRDGEEPLLESTAGRTMELVLEQPEVEGTDVLAPIPLRSVPGAYCGSPGRRNSVGSFRGDDVAGVTSRPKIPPQTSPLTADDISRRGREAGPKAFEGMPVDQHQLAHIPRSDGVPVSVATVSPKDSELLGKLEEAGNAAYQVGSSERSRCHSI